MTTYKQVDSIAVRAGFKSYKDYLLTSSHWLHLKSLLGLPHRACCVCGTRDKLLAHHIRYRNLFDVTPEDLVVMCEGCHDDFHMACRRHGIDCIGLSSNQICKVVCDFRATPWHHRRLEKLKRRKEHIKLPAQQPVKQGKSTIRKRFRQFLKDGPNRKKAVALYEWLLEAFPEPN